MLTFPSVPHLPLDLTTALDRAAALVREADALVIAAGAGMGVDSGLPDFRGDTGFWQAYPALGQAGLNFRDIASAENFDHDAQLAWGFYGHRLKLYRDTKPHQGFAILQKWAQSKAAGAFVYTSNVDGQFQKAGFAEDELEECHGSIHHLQCAQHCTGDVVSAQALQPQVDEQQCRWQGALPSCPQCGAVLRPNIFMFNDAHWADGRSYAQERRLIARLQQWQQQGIKPLVIELGAGQALATVRHFSAGICRQFAAVDAALLRINVRESEVARPLDVGLAMGALAALTAVDARLAHVA